jgi:hypothetical protein
MGRGLFQAHARARFGITFRLSSPADEPAVFAFRHRIYESEGYLAPEAAAKGALSDEFDPVSVNAIAEYGGQIVGVGRATGPSEALFPTLKYFNVELPPGVQTQAMMEMGRFMVSADFRGRARVVSVGLSQQLRIHVRKNPHIQWLLASMNEGVRAAFSGFVPFERLKELPLKAEHEAARQALGGYFERNEAHPVLAHVRDF